MKIIWMIIAFVSGAFLPIQAALNTRLGKSIASPVHASMLSFFIGAFAVVIYLQAMHSQVSWAGIRSAPFYSLLGGVLGAFYVTAVTLAFPKIGPALTFGLVVAGQMVIAVLLDHFNILVTHQHSINAGRAFGVLLLVAGVIIIRNN